MLRDNSLPYIIVVKNKEDTICEPLNIVTQQRFVLVVYLFFFICSCYFVDQKNYIYFLPVPLFHANMDYFRHHLYLFVV
jgi:hypothetical protein